MILGQLALPEVVRRGAQLMLQHAVELEMTEYLGREYYRNDAETTAARGRRNGYRTRPVRTGEGSLEIQLPEARDVPPGRPRFQSKILEAYVSRTESLETLITRMYVAGMSTRDIETAFVDLLSGHGVSRTTVSRITERLNEDLEQFRTADLSGHDVLYLILDRTYIKYRVGAERKEPILVAYGYRTDGKKVLLHVGPGSQDTAVRGVRRQPGRNPGDRGGVFLCASAALSAASAAEHPGQGTQGGAQATEGSDPGGLPRRHLRRRPAWKRTSRPACRSCGCPSNIDGGCAPATAISRGRRTAQADVGWPTTFLDYFCAVWVF